MAAAAAGADREFSGVPQHRHRIRQLARHPLAALAQCGTAAGVRVRSRVRRRRANAAGDGRDAGRRNGLLGCPSVADVPATVAETVLLAALVRGAVITALEAEQRGESLAPLAPHALRAAYWKSAREGLDGHAVDLTESHATVPAQELLNRLVDHVRPALETVGDYDMVCTELVRVAEVGNGAMRQRRAWQRRHDIDD